VATVVGILAALAPHLVPFMFIPWAGWLFCADQDHGGWRVSAQPFEPARFFSLLMRDGSILFYLTLFIACLDYLSPCAQMCAIILAASRV